MKLGPGIVGLLLELEKLVPEGVMSAAVAELEQLGMQLVEKEAPRVIEAVFGDHEQTIAKDFVLREELLQSGQAVSFTTTGPTVVITGELAGKPAVRIVVDVDSIGEKALPFLAQELDMLMPGAGKQLRQLTTRA